MTVSDGTDANSPPEITDSIWHLKTFSVLLRGRSTASPAFNRATSHSRECCCSECPRWCDAITVRRPFECDMAPIRRSCSGPDGVKWEKNKIWYVYLIIFYIFVASANTIDSPGDFLAFRIFFFFFKDWKSMTEQHTIERFITNRVSDIFVYCFFCAQCEFFLFIFFAIPLVATGWNKSV